MSLFTDFPLLPTLQATLAEKAFRVPTDIQGKTVPPLLSGQSLVGVSETGSGKTLAYTLPMLHLLKALEAASGQVTENGQPRAAVIVPTRELGEQVSRVFKQFTHNTRLRVRTVLGGTTMAVAKKNISGPFEILVATPGRLLQLMEQKFVQLGSVGILVFDEADQLLDQGFLEDATRIAEACLPTRQLALFSATVSATVQELITTLFSDAAVFRSKGSNRLVPTLTTVNRSVRDGKRFPILESILAEEVVGGTLIFTNTREQCDRLAQELTAKEKVCVIYRGEMDKVERRANLKAFREGKVGLLVSTDLASRGLDLEHVGRVINYHMPQKRENYVHRVGRTARAGRAGTVINFVTDRDRPLIERYAGK